MSDTIEHAYPTHAHPTMDTTGVAQSIHELHTQICTHGKRVEVSRAGCNDRCVIISKSELDSLEQAVEIFADTEAFAEMSRSIQQLLNIAGLVYPHDGAMDL